MLAAGCGAEPEPAASASATSTVPAAGISEAPALDPDGGTGAAPVEPAPAGADPLAAWLDALPPLETVSPREPRVIPGELADHFTLIRTRRTGPARVRLRRHLAATPSDPVALFLFGLSYHREKKYSEAAPWFDRALAADPDYDAPWYFAAWGRLNLGRPEVARRLFLRHLAMRPTAADSHFGLGLLDLEAGDPVAAEASFRRAIDLESGDPARARDVGKAWARLGDALADQGRPEDARAAFQTAVDLWPDHHEAWARLARVARRLGDEPAAVAAEAARDAALDRTRAGQAPPPLAPEAGRPTPTFIPAVGDRPAGPLPSGSRGGDGG